MPLTVCVLAPKADASLRLLETPPDGVRFVVGERPEDFAEVAPQADVLCLVSGGRALLEPVFARAPRVSWIHVGWAGLDGVLFPALVESPVAVTNARGVFSRSLAEFVIAAVLFYAKDLRRMLRAQASARWEPFDVAEIHGQSLGILGYGDIGRAVAERARALGMRVNGERRAARASQDPLLDAAFTPERRAELIAGSDYVVLALPATPDTRGLFGERELAAMKRTAVVINVGRGSTLDEPALIRALEARRIRGAALDVFASEPLPPDHPFYRLDNVLVSPHTADRTASWRDDAMRLFLANLERFRSAQPLLNPIDKRRGY
jgi:phosphoglycerate dehydrogenase-like enzyme